MLHHFELVFPLSGEQGRLKLFGKNGNQRHAHACRYKVYRFFCFIALYKAGGNQLFDDTGTSSRRTQALTLGIVGHFLCPCQFHSREQGIFGEVCWRFGRSFLDFGAYHIQLDSLGKFGQNLVALLLFVVDFPAHFGDILALGDEDRISASDFSDCFSKLICFADSTEHLFCNHHKDFTLTSGERVQIRLTGNHRGNNGMVVRYLLAIAYLCCINNDWIFAIHNTDRTENHSFHSTRHIIGKVSAVGTRIGAEFLFIKALNII